MAATEMLVPHLRATLALDWSFPALRPLLQQPQGQGPAPALGAVPPLERLDHDKPATWRGTCGRRHNRFIPARPRGDRD